MVGKRVRVHFSVAALVNAPVQKHGIAIRSGRRICLDCYGLFPGSYPFSWGKLFHFLVSRAALFHQNRRACWYALAPGLSPGSIFPESHTALLRASMSS